MQEAAPSAKGMRNVDEGRGRRPPDPRKKEKGVGVEATPTECAAEGAREAGPDLAFYGVPAVQPIWSPLERADAQAQRLGMRPLIDEDLAHLGVPAAYTWHIPIAEWNALMKALHGNGMSKSGPE